MKVAIITLTTVRTARGGYKQLYFCSSEYVYGRSVMSFYGELEGYGDTPIAAVMKWREFNGYTRIKIFVKWQVTRK